MRFYTKSLLLGLSVFSGFVFVTTFLALSLQSNLPPELCSCSPWAWLPYLIPLLSSLGLFVGGVVFYFTESWVEHRASQIEAQALITQLLSCLPEEEAEVVSFLTKGPATQAEIGRKLGLGKVKAHRIIKRLEERGVVKVKKAGKTNQVFLTGQLESVQV